MRVRFREHSSRLGALLDAEVPRSVTVSVLLPVQALFRGGGARPGE